jgi:hypothetical protein
MTTTLTMLAESGWGQAFGVVIFIVIAIISWIVKAANSAAEERKLAERRDRHECEGEARHDPPPMPRRGRRGRRPAKQTELDADLAIAVEAAPQPEPEPTRVEPTRVNKPMVHLTAKTARQAIIMHEILSPPKAMQQETAMWDR